MRHLKIMLEHIDNTLVSGLEKNEQVLDKHSKRYNSELISQIVHVKPAFYQRLDHPLKYFCFSKEALVHCHHSQFAAHDGLASRMPLALRAFCSIGQVLVLFDRTGITLVTVRFGLDVYAIVFQISVGPYARV